MWRIKDWSINLLLDIRLWFLINFKPKRFCVLNNTEKEGWKLTFNDEFDESKLNVDKWLTKSYDGLSYHPGNIYYKNKAPDEYLSPVYNTVENGILKQKATNTPKKIHYIDWDGKDWGEWIVPYQIGKLDSSKSFEQMYGYFEIRSKQPNQPGHWTAFWLASVHAWPPEIDIYEIYTGKKNGKGIKQFNSNFHWSSNTENNKSKVKSHKILNTAENFHTYAVDWNEKGFKIYYDNLLVRIYSNPEAIREFKYPMHIILNNGIDVRPENGIDKVNFPTYHKVDYIRAYKRK